MIVRIGQLPLSGQITAGSACALPAFSVERYALQGRELS